MELDEAEGWWTFWETNGTADDPERAAARTLHAEYDRRGAALADAQAEIARLRATVDAVQKFCDDWCAPGDWHPFDQVRRTLRRALAAAPAPAEDEDTRWREHEAVVDGGYCGCEYPRLWPPAPAREQADPADERGGALVGSRVVLRYGVDRGDERHGCAVGYYDHPTYLVDLDNGEQIAWSERLTEREGGGQR